MAQIEIKSAFVEKWNRNGDPHPGWGMRTSEPHSRKRDDGSFETTGRTFRTVKVSRGSGIDLAEFNEGDRVRVTGREVTESREHEGKKFYDLVVWADSVELESRQPRDAVVPPSAPAGDDFTGGGYPDATGSGFRPQGAQGGGGGYGDSYSDSTPF